jgi:hypothetical protein
MFCPKCKAEYLHGVSRCSDCDVVLVESLSESDRDSDDELSKAKLKTVWSGEDQYDCVGICEQLRDAEIPFKVIQHSRQFLKGVDDHYEIGVPPKFLKQAEEIIDSGRLDFTDEPSDQAIMELPAQDGMADATEVDNEPDSDRWKPENATVEVWSQRGPKDALMIESSLRENYINYRADDLDNGMRKIFVMPKDELRSREIVREIENGTPPK